MYLGDELDVIVGEVTSHLTQGGGGEGVGGTAAQTDHF